MDIVTNEDVFERMSNERTPSRKEEINRLDMY